MKERVILVLCVAVFCPFRLSVVHVYIFVADDITLLLLLLHICYLLLASYAYSAISLSFDKVYVLQHNCIT